MKRYPNGILTGTCSMVRGPDEKPEVERQGSERESVVVNSSSGFQNESILRDDRPLCHVEGINSP